MNENVYKKSGCCTPTKTKENINFFQSQSKLTTTDISKNNDCNTPNILNSKEKYSITTPIKKSKRRDCTPYYSPDRVTTKKSEDFFGITRNLAENEINSNKVDNFTEEESSTILSKIKGNLFLLKLDQNNQNQNFLSILLSDNSLMSMIISELCTNFFEGFNSRNQQCFFKYLVKLFE